MRLSQSLNKMKSILSASILGIAWANANMHAHPPNMCGTFFLEKGLSQWLVEGMPI